MKKIVSVLLLCAMLMSLVVVSSVSVSAEGATETPAAPRTGAYASIKPTIDGTIDEFWETAVRLDINSEIYAKVLWDEGGLYLLANVAGYEKISFLIAENYWGDESTSWEWDDQYTVTFYKDGKIDVLNPNYNWFHLPKTGVEQRAVKETSNGFVVEAYIPRVSEGAYAVNSGIKLGVVIDPWVNNGMLNWGAWTHEEWNGAKQVDWLTLAANSGLPQAKNTSIVLRGIQTTAMKDGTYDARFVSEMIGLDAECAGFEVSGFYGKDAEHQNEIPKQDLITTKAYISIMAGDKKVVPTADGNYLIALAVSGIPVSDEVVTVIFTVKPFTMNADGEKNYGEEATFTVVSGECR